MSDENLINDIKEMLCKAISAFYRKDKELIKNHTHERTCVFRIAHYMLKYLECEDILPKYLNLDLEYNRRGISCDDTKRSHALNKNMIPDLIVHERGNTEGNNLLVIEFKQYNKNEDCKIKCVVAEIVSKVKQLRPDINKDINEAIDKITNEALDKNIKKQEKNKLINEAIDKIINEAIDKIINEAIDKNIYNGINKETVQGIFKDIYKLIELTLKKEHKGKYCYKLGLFIILGKERDDCKITIVKNGNVLENKYCLSYDDFKDYTYKSNT